MLNGSRVSVRRVLGDGVRLFGTAGDIIDRATKTQRALLLGVTPGFLAARKEDARIPVLRVAALRGVFQRKVAKKKPAAPSAPASEPAPMMAHRNG